MPNRVGQKLREKLTPKTLAAQITSTPRDAAGHYESYVLATVAGHTGVRVNVGPDHGYRSGDYCLVAPYGTPAATSYSVLGYSAGPRANSIMSGFNESTTLLQYTVEAGDQVLGDPTTSTGSSWRYVYRYGRWNIYSGSTLRGAIGNLNAVYNYETDTYGMAWGTEAGHHVCIDETNGIRFLQNQVTLGSWLDETITLGQDKDIRLRLSPGLIEFLDADDETQMGFDGSTQTIYGVQRFGSPLGPSLELGLTEGGRYAQRLLGENGVPFYKVVSGTQAEPNDVQWRIGPDGATSYAEWADETLTVAGVFELQGGTISDELHIEDTGSITWGDGWSQITKDGIDLTADGAAGITNRDLLRWMSGSKNLFVAECVDEIAGDSRMRMQLTAGGDITGTDETYFTVASTSEQYAYLVLRATYGAHLASLELDSNKGTTLGTAIITADSTIIGSNTTIGAGTAGVDYTLTFNGQDNDGVLTWMEDEDYLKFGDDVLIDGAEKVLFRDTALGIYSQADTFLDVFADGGVRIGDSASGAPTNYSKFESDGTLVFNGAATVFNDANVGGLVLRTGGTAPGVVQILDNDGDATGIYTIGFAVDEQGSGVLEMPHNYKEGSNIVFHIHWGANDAPAGGTDNVKWQLTYSIARDSNTFPDAITPAAVEVAYTTQYNWLRTDLATITGSTGGVDGNNIKIGDQFFFTLKRIAASGDEFGGEALLATAGFHYESDTVGSRAITSK